MRKNIDLVLRENASTLYAFVERMARDKYLTLPEVKRSAETLISYMQREALDS